MKPTAKSLQPAAALSPRLSADSFTKSGTKATTATKLDKAVFAVMPANHELLKLAYTAYLSNGREHLAITKTRGLVRGGGKKPWKQKGTGRARFGSTRNPIWRGGGVAFGPTGQENYTKKMPLGAKRQAIRQALSLAAADGHIKIVESFEYKDAKVSAVASLLKKIDAQGSVLIVVDKKDELTERATRNLPNVRVIQAMYLNVFDLLNSDAVVIEHKALEIINQWLTPTPKSATKKEETTS